MKILQKMKRSHCSATGWILTIKSITKILSIHFFVSSAQTAFLRFQTSLFSDLSSTHKAETDTFYPFLFEYGAV